MIVHSCLESDSVEYNIFVSLFVFHLFPEVGNIREIYWKICIVFVMDGVSSVYLKSVLGEYKGILVKMEKGRQHFF